MTFAEYGDFKCIILADVFELTVTNSDRGGHLP